MPELKDATTSMIQTNQGDEFFRKVFGSVEGGEKFLAQINDARNQLYEKFEVFQRVGQKTQPRTIDANFVDAFYDNFAVVNSSRLFHSSATGRIESGEVCGSAWQRTKLYICSAACGASSVVLGPAALLCLWGCWCELCDANSTVADVMC